MYDKKFVITEENAAEYAAKLADFVRIQVENAGMYGVVLGMSGGIDCSVCACLAKLSGVDTLLVMLPDGNGMKNSGSMDDAMSLIDKFGFDHMTVDISGACIVIEAAAGRVDRSAAINIRPRVRMTTLYAIAQSKRRLVMGTGNLAERLTGYFTKWGDGGCDFNPLAMLTKGEVRILARELGVPEQIINKAPSADLYFGQTDEQELGIKYDQIDAFILKGTTGDEETDKRLNQKIAASAHKLKPIPVFNEK